MANIYPEINLPQLATPRTLTPAALNKIAPFFDFDSGEFKFSTKGEMILADSRETFEQWAIKAVMTERGTRLAYSEKIGAEMETAMKMKSIDAVKSSIVRTVTETILTHPRARAVKNFLFSAEADRLQVSFDVLAIDFNTRLEVAF